MWSDERSVWQGDDGEDHEDDHNPHQPGGDVAVPVRHLVAGKSRVSEGYDGDEHGGDGVRLVEELQADVVHWSLVD